MKDITLPLVKKEVKKVMAIKDETDPQLKTGIILMSALVVGPNVKKISSFTGYNRKDVSEKIKIARQKGIVKGNKLAIEWFEDAGGIAFCCDCMVIDGLLERK